MNQTAIPYVFMRGGTSAGPYFLADDLPPDRAVRDCVLFAVNGVPSAEFAAFVKEEQTRIGGLLEDLGLA